MQGLVNFESILENYDGWVFVIVRKRPFTTVMIGPIGNFSDDWSDTPFTSEFPDSLVSEIAYDSAHDNESNYQKKYGERK